MESSSENSQLAAKTQGTFKLSGDYLEQLGLGGEVGFIRSVTLNLTNVRVLEITDGTVFTTVKNATQGCRNAVKFRIERGDPIALIKSVVKADVSYAVNFTSTAGLDAMDRRRINKELATKLDADLTSITDSGFDGVGLFWGVRYDAKLARLITPETAALEPAAVERLLRKIGRVFFPVRGVTVVHRGN